MIYLRHAPIAVRAIGPRVNKKISQSGLSLSCACRRFSVGARGFPTLRRKLFSTEKKA